MLKSSIRSKLQDLKSKSSRETLKCSNKYSLKPKLSFFVSWKDLHLEYGLGNFVKPHYFLSMLMWIQTVYLNSIFWPKSGFYVFQDQLNQKYGLSGITTKMRRTEKIVFFCLIFIFPAGPWKCEACLEMKYVPIKFPKKVLFIGAIYFIGLLLRFTSHSPA